ncbi:MAG: SLC13 family permease [Suipraeoptans sp.]
MKKKIGFVTGVAAVISSLWVEDATLKTVLFIIAFMIILVTEVIPILLLSIMALGIMPMIGITDTFQDALVGFSSQVVFFIIMSFGLAKIISEVPLCKRMLLKMFKIFGNRIDKMILAIMICVALTSSFISNVPACVIYMTFAEELLKLYENEDKRKSTGKALMLGISFASMIGGIITPVGSTVNILALDILEESVGVQIGFVQWMSYGLTFAIIALPLCWMLLIKLFKPTILSDKVTNGFIQSLDIPQRYTMAEIKVLGIMGIMIVLWISSSWISSINVMLVLFMGVCILSIPKVGVAEIEDVIKSVNWEIVFLAGVILSLSDILVKKGFGEVLGQYIPQFQISIPLFCIFTSLCIFVLLLVVPIAQSLTMISVPLFIIVGQQVGVHPVFTTIICSMSIGCGYFLPLDAVYLVTYSKHYYTIKDMSRTSLGLTSSMTILLATLGYGISYLWGLV